jgi:ribosomal protein L11 methyltransferase
LRPTVCVRIRAPGRELERLVAELHSLGTLGIEERENELLAYFERSQVPEQGIQALADAAGTVQVSPLELVPPTDWEREWRAGLRPRRVGPLWIRPSWCESAGTPEIVIDPEQAFGSGEHASTRLALKLVLDALGEGDRVLDLGCGSGILGLGALRLGAAQAWSLDIDRQACRNAAKNGVNNDLTLRLICGTLDAIESREPFDLVVANMLPAHLSRWLPRLAAHTSRALVLSGYLTDGCAELCGRVRELGWVMRCALEEAQSGDVWGASLWTQTRDLQSSRRSSRVSSKR